MLVDCYIPVSANASNEVSFYCRAGGIAIGMQDSRTVMSAFASKGKSGVVAVKLDAAVYQFLDPLGGFAGEDFNGFLAAYATPRFQRILRMGLRVVPRCDCYRNATLGLVGAPFPYFLFCNNKDGGILSRFEGSTEPGYTAPDDKDVGKNLGNIVTAKMHQIASQLQGLFHVMFRINKGA
jgi:hypothetical protein